jgi:predicted nucleic acid-binding protein
MLVSAALWHDLDIALSALEPIPATCIPVNASIPDPDDIPTLACALVAKADVFVTGDKAPLALRQVGDMPLLSPRQLWRRLSAHEA